MQAMYVLKVDDTKGCMSKCFSDLDPSGTGQVDHVVFAEWITLSYPEVIPRMAWNMDKGGVGTLRKVR